MQESTPPKVTKIEVIAARPTDADRAAITHLSASARKPLPEVTYLVKVHLETIPPATSHGWALYVNDFRIPKYWEYNKGVYFKVFDEEFFREHRKQPLRFSRNGTEFIDTGVKLSVPRAPSPKSAKKLGKLPLQDKILK